ncbi:MAG: HlyD family efflux transporter periplasmic adaptor subunit [Proteobacteria bacterium]|nr:HlyD family efflux transporter periplasmic adaptor subunit [Pseudomonadota bacterium]
MAVSASGMDRKVAPSRWSSGAKVAGAVAAAVCILLAAIEIFVSSGVQTLRMPAAQVSFATVEQGIFHDLIPLRASVVPRETLYVDAVDGGRVDRVLVEAGDMVQQGQPIIELSNTNLALSVIQQESQLNQAISQLQQNEIALEQNKLSNERALAEVEYGLVRLKRSGARRDNLVSRGLESAEQRDVIADELAYYQHLMPIQTDSNQRQASLRERLLPDIHRQLAILRGNLDVVHRTLDGLIVRAPVSGRVTAIDLKVGEHKDAGQRLAEVTPPNGMKLSADIDEFYLARVRLGQQANIDLHGKPVKVTVKRIYPQVHDGRFRVDFAFGESTPADLVAGETAQGRLQLGDDSPARIVPAGPFLERTGGDWIFVVAADGKSAERRQIKVGRRTVEQLEITSGLAVGERVMISDYAALDKAGRVVLTH